MQRKQSKIYLKLATVFLAFMPLCSFSQKPRSFILFICQNTTGLEGKFKKVLLVNCTTADTVSLLSIPSKVDSLRYNSNYKIFFFRKRKIYEVSFDLLWKENPLSYNSSFLQICFTPIRNKKKNQREADVYLWDGVMEKSTFSRIIRW